MRAGTAQRCRRFGFMPADPRGTDPDDRDPREAGLQRRSGAGGAMTPWLVVLGIILLGFIVYVASAIL